MNTQDIHLDTAHVRAALFQFVKTTSALVTACGIIIVALWYAISPRVDLYLEERSKPVQEQLNEIKASLAFLMKEMQNNKDTDFIEFRGRGIVEAGGPFRAGQTVPIAYTMRRNRPCLTDIEVRFRRREIQRIDTSLSYLIASTRAPITDTFITFSVDVRLPDHMQPGWYSYAPLVTPRDRSCGDVITAPLSDYFEVVK